MPGAGPLLLVQEIPLVGPSAPDGAAAVQPRGRLDHFSYDPATKLIYLACLGHNCVAVIDAFGGLMRGTIRDQVKQPQGVLFVAQTGRLYVANTKGTVSVYEGVSAEPSTTGDVGTCIATIDFGDEADNLRYSNGNVFVGYGEGAIGVIRDDVGGPQREESFLCSCRAHPESFQLETSGSRIFINVADERLVQVADRTDGTTVAEWSLPDGLAANFPMALDEVGGTLFVGVRKPSSQACVLALDTQNGRCKARIACVADADDLCFDAQRRRIYAIGGVGHVSIIDAVTFSVLGGVESALGSRTGLFYPERDALYVAAPGTALMPPRLLVYLPE